MELPLVSGQWIKLHEGSPQGPGLLQMGNDPKNHGKGTCNGRRLFLGSIYSALCVDAKVPGGRGASLSPLIMTSNLLSPRQDFYSRLLAQESFKGAGAQSPFGSFQSWSKTNSTLGKKRSANGQLKIK